MATYYLPNSDGWLEDRGYNFYLRLKVDTTYNASNNQTACVITPQVKTGGDPLTYHVMDNTYITVSGTTVLAQGSAGGTSATPYDFVTVTGSWVSLTENGATKTFSYTATHNDNGVANITFTIHGRFTADNQSQYISQNLNRVYLNNSDASLTLSEARLTTISASNGTIGTAITITATRKSTAYTHTIKTSCLGVTETLATKSTSSSISWTPALATYAPLMPNAMSATATITCTTYSGNNAIGTNTITITISLAAADVKPTVSLTVADAMGYFSTYGAYVATKSKLTVTLNQTLEYGASAKTIAITANGQSYASSPITTGELVSTSVTSVTGKVTDSRNQSSSTASTTISILAYTAPKVNSFAVHRCNSSGVSDDSGAYMRVDYSVAITALNNHNSKSLTIKYKKRSASSYSTTTVTMSSYSASGNVVIAADVNSTYDVQIVLTDDFGSTTVTTQLSTAAVMMNFGSGSNSGVAFGKVSERNNALQVSADWGMYLGEANIADLFYTAKATYSTGAYYPAFGYITSGGTDAIVFVMLPKLIPAGWTVAVSSALFSVRTSDGGYLGGSGRVDLTSNISSASINGLTLYLDLYNSSGWGITNNTPLVGIINLTFSLG